MENEDFPQNLSLLCSYERSIAEVCRKLRINRQQFNKYLSGTVFPSRHNLRVICDHFGVTDSEILMPTANFADIVTLKSRPPSPEVENGILSAQTLHRLQGHSQEIADRYLGYYFRYYYSFAFPGYVTKSLVVIFRHQRSTYWKNMEILRRRDRREKVQAVFKYIGLVALIAERIFVFEEEVILKNSVTQTILYPSYTSRVRQLIGIQTSAANLNRRTPAASRVLLEYIAPSVNVRKALKACGQYRDRDSQIGRDIRSRIANVVPKTVRVLSAWTDD